MGSFAFSLAQRVEECDQQLVVRSMEDDIITKSQLNYMDFTYDYCFMGFGQFTPLLKAHFDGLLTASKLPQTDHDFCHEWLRPICRVIKCPLSAVSYVHVWIALHVITDQECLSDASWVGSFECLWSSMVDYYTDPQEVLTRFSLLVLLVGHHWRSNSSNQRKWFHGLVLMAMFRGSYSEWRIATEDGELDDLTFINFLDSCTNYMTLLCTRTYDPYHDWNVFHQSAKHLFHYSSLRVYMDQISLKEFIEIQDGLEKALGRANALLCSDTTFQIVNLKDVNVL